MNLSDGSKEGPTEWCQSGSRLRINNSIAIRLQTKHKMKSISALIVICFVDSTFGALGDQCEDGWHRSGAKCFKYHNDLAGANFHDAMTICQYVYEATLVTIHSQEEFDFLTTMVFEQHHAKYSIWIGLIRLSNDSFVWFDRSALNYTNWGPNEPNNWQSKNYCVVMSSASTARGKWFDVGCTTTYLVMCQKYLTANDSQSDSDLSIADTINMQLEQSEQSLEQMLLNNELSSLRTLANTNIVLTVILFVALIASVLKYNYKFSFIRRNSFSSFDNSLVRDSTEI